MDRHLLTCPVPSSNEPTQQQQPSIEMDTIEESKDDFSAFVEIVSDSSDDDHGDNCGVSDPL